LALPEGRQWGQGVVLALPRGCRCSFDLVVLVTHLGEVPNEKLCTRRVFVKAM
jgi:hypothetical protein